MAGWMGLRFLCGRGQHCSALIALFFPNFLSVRKRGEHRPLTAVLAYDVTAARMGTALSAETLSAVMRRENSAGPFPRGRRLETDTPVINTGETLDATAAMDESVEAGMG
jgi:hypothetical protein